MLSDTQPLVGFLYNDHKEVEIRIKYGNGVTPYFYTPVYDRAKYSDGFHPSGITLQPEIVKVLGECLLEEGRGCQLILHPWWTAWE
jgi:hypothetical protein